MTSLSTVATRLRPVVRFVGAENLSLLIVLAIEVAVIVSQSPFFLGQRNLLNSLGQNIAVLGVLAVGESIVIIAGALDISVGSVAGIAGVVAALAVNASWGRMQYALVAGLIAGLIAGLVNGSIVAFLRVNPIIATLGTFAAFRGEALGIRTFILTRDRSDAGTAQWPDTLLVRLFDDLAGYHWKGALIGGAVGSVNNVVEMATDSSFGYQVLAGGIDAYTVTRPSRTFNATSNLRVTQYVLSRSALQHAIVAGHAQVAIEIPPDYARNLAAGRQANVLVMIDGSDSSSPEDLDLTYAWTDVDEEELATARAAIYTERQMENLSPELRAKYFEPAGAKWSFRKDLRRSVIFEHHAAKLLFHSIHWQVQLTNCEQGLFIGICTGCVIVEVRESA